MKQAVSSQMDHYNCLLKGAIVSDMKSLQVVSKYLLTPSGKQMRPLLSLLTAELHGTINDKSYAAAMLFEMLHWATLVHDDVVDEAYMRRSELTLGAMMRSKNAVLVGDFLFSRGLAVAARAENFYAITAATRVIEQVVDGELMQAKHASRLSTTREDYMEIIRLKTAVLIASAAEVGADSVGADTECVKQMYRFGELLGLAFQIQDDILDIESSQSGKAKYNDFRERKITLPLIYAMERDGRAKALKHLRQACSDERSVEWLLDFIGRNGGVEHAKEVMNGLHAQAMEILSGYADGAVKESLAKYCNYVVGRKL